jgi:outer membrane protein assembly factor BamA
LLTSGAAGGNGWNPLSTGRTYLQLTPFYETQTIETNPHDLHFDENGLRFAVVYDNRDFPLNPSSGNLSKITFSRDFGLFESSNSWSNVSSEFAQYLDLGRSNFFKQQVLALDLWTSYSITWDQPHRGGGLRILSSSPPFYDGSVLGGDTRLRGFATNRFWDRAAVYGSIELRVIPYWNPLGEIKILKSADIAWMQWVVFLEAGRVAGEYSPALLNHLKGDAGFGVRLLANDTIVRLDVAASNEGFGVWAGLNQPF